MIKKQAFILLLLLSVCHISFAQDKGRIRKPRYVDIHTLADFQSVYLVKQHYAIDMGVGINIEHTLSDAWSVRFGGDFVGIISPITNFYWCFPIDLEFKYKIANATHRYDPYNSSGNSLYLLMGTGINLGDFGESKEYRDSEGISYWREVYFDARIHATLGLGYSFNIAYNQSIYTEVCVKLFSPFNPEYAFVNGGFDAQFVLGYCFRFW